MSGPRRRRFADLEGLVRPEDRVKLRAIDRGMDAVREKHHPGSIDPDEPESFLVPHADDELEDEP